MKTIYLIILSLFFYNSILAQSTDIKEIKTEVCEVTVFLKGAQVTSRKAVDLPVGISILKFTNLSPYIETKSIQVKTDNELTILAINHQPNFIEKPEIPKELSDLESRLTIIENKITLENTYLSILKEQIAFLQANREIGGKNQELSVQKLKEAADFYGNQLTALKLKEIERNQTLVELEKQKADLKNQVNTLTSKKDYPNGEILVKVDSKKNVKVTFELSYVVENAGWYPSYDIRAKNINEPIELIYKANVRQDTKMDWNNVKLKFSSADLNTSGVAPELKTYYLNYFSLPPVYNRAINSVSGQVLDQNQQPLPGTCITVQGTTIATVTDLNGNYSIILPNQSNYLTYSFIGFLPKTLPITGNIMNVVLEENTTALEEVAVVGYGIQRKGPLAALQGKVAGVMTKEKTEKSIRGTNTLPVPSIAIEKQTSVDFEIKTPYSIKSDNKNYTVDMDVYELPASYQYFSVPKIDKTVFLLANIIDWEKYNLLEGEANIFFENTYVGKTLLDTRSASDTLQISLGQDKNVTINREKQKNFTTKQFIGNKKEETRSWKTTVRNNKNQAINMTILDQIPISTLDEIEVSVQNISGAKHNTETGEIKWELNLDPKGKKELELNYSVKYPKNKKLQIE